VESSGSGHDRRMKCRNEASPVNRSPNRGFSLVEVMVALAIFSTGLGGLSLLLLLALQETAASRLQSYAASQAWSMAEFILVSPGAASSSLSPAASQGCLFDGVCEPPAMVSAALHEWRKGLADGLPHGDGLVCHDGTPTDGSPRQPACDGDGPLHVKVFWLEPGGGDSASPSPRRAVARVPLL